MGGLSHAEWRSWYNPARLPSQLISEGEPISRGFVDGDLLETFLELPRCVAQQLTCLCCCYGVPMAACMCIHMCVCVCSAKMDEIVVIMNGDGEGSEGNVSLGLGAGPVTVDGLLRVIEELARSH